MEGFAAPRWKAGLIPWELSNREEGAGGLRVPPMPVAGHSMVAGLPNTFQNEGK